MTDILTYDWNGQTHPMASPQMSDLQVAVAVRMLMRTQLNHESICTLARDRIMALPKDRARLLEENARLKEATKQDLDLNEPALEIGEAWKKRAESTEDGKRDSSRNHVSEEVLKAACAAARLDALREAEIVALKTGILSLSTNPGVLAREMAEEIRRLRNV